MLLQTTGLEQGNLSTPPIAYQHSLFIFLLKEASEISQKKRKKSKKDKPIVPSAQGAGTNISRCKVHLNMYICPLLKQWQIAVNFISRCFTVICPLLRRFPLPRGRAGALPSPSLLQHLGSNLAQTLCCILYNFIGLTFQLLNSPYQQIKASSSRWAKWLRKP